jgi:hypothetical protein
MGTRARINIIDGNKCLVSIYRQFDGYPSGLGHDVAKFAKKLQIVNGFSGDGKGQANGMGCFAAQLIKHLKHDTGNVYIRDTSDESHGEEYSYDLSERNGKIWMAIYGGSVTFFGMPGDKQSEMKAIWAGPIDKFNGSKVEEAA